MSLPLYERLIELIPGPMDFVWGSVAAAVVYSVGVKAAVGGHARGLRTGDTRKLFHLMVFCGAGALRTFAPISAVVAYGAWGVLLILYAIRRGTGYPLFESVARPEDGEQRGLNIFFSLVSTGAGGVLAHLLVGQAAVVSYLVGGCGDAMGEPIGIRWGKHPLPLRSKLLGRRTVEGSLGVLTGSFVAAMGGLMLLGVGPLPAGMRAAVIAPVVMVVEAISPRGTDNFTIQVTTALAILVLW